MYKSAMYEKCNREGFQVYRTATNVETVTEIKCQRENETVLALLCRKFNRVKSSV